MDRVAGRIKVGEGTLIGKAGSYYVVAELLVAALAPRNAPGFDVLATKGALTENDRWYGTLCNNCVIFPPASVMKKCY